MILNDIMSKYDVEINKVLDIVKSQNLALKSLWNQIDILKQKQLKKIFRIYGIKYTQKYTGDVLKMTVCNKVNSIVNSFDKHWKISIK